MRQYWVTESIPELAGFSESARRRIWAVAYRRTRWGRWRVTSILVAAAVTVSLVCFWKWSARDGEGLADGFWGLAQMVVVIFASEVVARQITIRAALPYVRRVVRERCMRCGGTKRDPGACGDCAVAVVEGGPGTVEAIEYQDAEARREEERARGEGSQERAYLFVLLAIVLAVWLTAALVVRYVVRWRAASPPPPVWAVPVAVPTTQPVAGGRQINVARPQK